MADEIFPDLDESKLCRSFPRAYLGETIEDVEKMLSKKAASFDTIDYIYILDLENVLSGVISIKNIFSISDKKLLVDDFMDRDLVMTHPSTGPERIVYLALSHGIKAVPIVDDEKHLLCIVPYDSILEIFNQQVKKDIFRFGGIFHRVGSDTSITSTAGMMIKSRLPWLILGVLGGTAAASVVSSFEAVLSKFIVLAAFIPVLVYMSDAVGTQSEALIIRSLALDPELSVRTYILREFKISIMLAVICGILISIVAVAGWGTYYLGAVVGFSMFLSIIAAVAISTLLPMAFKRFNYDPAVATGPLATIISDLLTLTIYFTVAILLLTYLNLI